MNNKRKKYLTQQKTQKDNSTINTIPLLFFSLILFLIGCDKEVTRSPVEPDPSQGVINISSSPRGATIFQNGRNTGRLTPDSLTFLSPDTYEITLKLKYFKDTSVTVNLKQDDQLSLSIDYLSNPSMYGNIILFSNPLGASITLNDSLLNEVTPDTLFGLLPGLYRVKFSLVNYRDKEINSLVESSVTRNFSVALRDTSVWVDYQMSNSGIQSNLLTAIAIDNNEVKWIGSSNIGLIRFNGLVFTNFNTTNSEIPSNNISCINVSTINEIWVGTDAGVAVYNHSSWRIYNSSNSGLGNDNVTSIQFDDGGNVWIGTTNGIVKYDGVNWERSTYVSGNVDFLWVSDFDIDNSEEKWIGTSSFGILSFNDNLFTEYLIEDYNYPTNKISCVEIDMLGNIWFGHLAQGTNRSGISFYNGSQFTSVFLGSSQIKTNEIKSDIFNNKWISSSEGFILLYPDNVSTEYFTTITSLISSNNISSS
ncbi:MAG: PEGA domain-containing protein, partial [Ignavibacteriaceae bacterium]